MTAYNTNLASEFYVLSMLYRRGLNANMTLGNKKSIDIVLTKQSGDVITIDVKKIAGKTLWPTDKLRLFRENHFIIIVSFLGKINDYSVVPEGYIVPSGHVKSLIYRNPNQTRQGVQLCTIRREGSDFKNAWHLLDG